MGKKVYFVVHEFPEVYTTKARIIAEKITKELFEEILPIYFPSQIRRGIIELKERVIKYCKSTKVSFQPSERYEKLIEKMNNFFKGLSFYDLPASIYGFLLIALETLKMIAKSCYEANFSAMIRYVAMDILIRGIQEGCEKITLYMEGEKSTPYSRSLEELAKRYNVEVKLIDENFPRFRELAEISYEVLEKCYGGEDEECKKLKENLREKVKELQREREEEWVKKLEKEKGCTIVLMGYIPSENLRKKLGERGIDYEIIIPRALILQSL